MACLRQSRVLAGVERCGMFSNSCTCLALGVMFEYFYVRFVAWLEVTYVACCDLFLCPLRSRAIRRLVKCSFHLYSFPFIFLSYSRHGHSNAMCTYVLSSSFHFAFMSFHFLSKVMKMALWLGQGTECNKWLSLSYR